MGLTLELIILLLIQLFASALFAHFEVGTPAWKRILKWLVIDGITIGLYYLVGHWALILPLTAIILGTTVHFIVCRKWGVDPFNATPKKKYYEMRGWKWEE